MGKTRERNIGWRIDYFIVSNDSKEKIKEAEIYPEIMGSDHCPVGLIWEWELPQYQLTHAKKEEINERN